MASGYKPVICVVGGGTAGLEGLLAARDSLGDDVELRRQFIQTNAKDVRFLDI